MPLPSWWVGGRSHPSDLAFGLWARSPLPPGDPGQQLCWLL